MYKKLCLIASVIILLVTMQTVAMAYISDIDGHWARDSIAEFISKGIISGYSDGTFKPDAFITRAELCTMAIKALNIDGDSKVMFKDTKKHWAKDYISKAYYKGIIKGYPDGSFKPDNYITREELASIISNIYTNKDVKYNDEIKDSNNISEWAKDSVKLALGNRYMRLYEDGTFKPTDKCTRAMAITVMKNIRDKNNIKETIDDTSINLDGDVRDKYDKEGIYGPESTVIKGDEDVRIASKDVTLRNMSITGNMVITEDTGKGTVKLDNVGLSGKLYINSGAISKLEIVNGSIKEIIINAKCTKFNIISKDKVDSITISKTAVGSNIIINGKYGLISVNAKDTKISIDGNSKIDKIDINYGGQNTTLTLSEDVELSLLEVGDVTKVKGEAVINKALVYAKTTFETQPKKLVDSYSIQEPDDEKYNLNIIIEPTGAGSVEYKSSYKKNTKVNIKATAESGYEFVEWTEDGAVIGSEKTLSFKISDNRTIKAIFKEVEPTVKIESATAKWCEDNLDITVKYTGNLSVYWDELDKKQFTITTNGKTYNPVGITKVGDTEIMLVFSGISSNKNEEILKYKQNSKYPATRLKDNLNRDVKSADTVNVQVPAKN
jgi:hypothetical protein